jgi:hypothetical protein
MQFQLPSNLQTELLAYDPKLKALARDKEPKKASKKSKYPLGNIPHIVPADVLRSADQQGAIDIINAAPAPQRIHSFTKPVDVATPQARTAVHTLIYHYEQCWYACWLPPKGQEDKYVYGHAYCFKDTAAAARTIPKSIWNSREDCIQTQVGRTVFYHRVRLVTKEDIANGYNGNHWRPGYYQPYADKVRGYITPCISNFEKELKESIPVWVDQRTMFGRLECKHIADALDISTLLLSKLDKPERRVAWLPSYESILELAVTASETDRAYAFDDYICFLNSNHILSKPFFRKWINAKCTEALDKFNDLTNEYHRKVTGTYKQIFRLAQSIRRINDIWPDCPIDFYQTNVDALLEVDLALYSTHNSTDEWLRQHMPVQSFFIMLSKFYVEAQEVRQRCVDYYTRPTNTEYGINTYRFSDWSDTYSMISRILNAGNELTPPKRWRISEFHDYVQAENWKIVNPNEKLHQDLFPEPIKVELDFADGFQNTWTFFQPHDTHQLAMWGQAVRNCVGSASHYAADIKKRKHFIVLAMIENKPKFTIQLKVDMGVMSVCQIAGIGNERLDDTERELYTEAFQLALHERETQLKS